MKTQEVSQTEKNRVEIWGVLLGFPIWLIISFLFYISGFYQHVDSPLLEWLGNDKNLLVIFISLPLSVGIAIGLFIGAVKVASKSHNNMYYKIAIAEAADVFLFLNLIGVSAGLITHYTFYSIRQSIPIGSSPIMIILALVIPIVGFPFVLDFAMPKLWSRLFGCSYGYFQGKLLKNLKRSWRKGDLQRDFRKSLVGALVLVFCILVLVAVLALMGLL